MFRSVSFDPGNHNANWGAEYFHHTRNFPCVAFQQVPLPHRQSLTVRTSITITLPILELHKNRSIQSVLLCLFFPHPVYFWDSILLLGVTISCSFLLLSIIPLYESSTINLPSYVYVFFPPSFYLNSRFFIYLSITSIHQILRHDIFTFPMNHYNDFVNYLPFSLYYILCKKEMRRKAFNSLLLYSKCHAKLPHLINLTER